MPRKQKPKTTANDTLGIVLPKELLAKIARKNVDFLTAAVQNAEELIESHSEEATLDSNTIAGKAAIFLLSVPSLLSTIEHGNREEALETAFFLGSSAPRFLSLPSGKTDLGKTLTEIVDAYGGHGKDGHGTKRIKDGKDIETLKTVFEKHRAEKHKYRNTAKELYGLGITGRGGKIMSARTVKRARGVARDILITSCHHLNQRFAQGIDPDVLGVFLDIENPTLIRTHNQAIWREGEFHFVFIGQTPSGHQLRVAYFDEAKIDGKRAEPVILDAVDGFALPAP